MCTVQLPPGANPTAVNKYIKYQFSGIPRAERARRLPWALRYPGQAHKECDSFIYASKFNALEKKWIIILKCKCQWRKRDLQLQNREQQNPSVHSIIFCCEKDLNV
jgi:hypothetical protein